MPNPVYTYVLNIYDCKHFEGNIFKQVQALFFAYCLMLSIIALYSL